MRCVIKCLRRNSPFISYEDYELTFQHNSSDKNILTQNMPFKVLRLWQEHRTQVTTHSYITIDEHKYESIKNVNLI